MSPDLEKHLYIFFAKIKSSQEQTEFAFPIIASFLILDGYPSDVHGKQKFRFGSNLMSNWPQSSMLQIYSKHFIEMLATK